MEPAIREAVARAVGRSRIDLLVRVDDGLASLGLADAVAQILDEFLKGPYLGLGRNVAVEIPDKADAKCNVVEIVAGDMAAV